ncbi:MAG: indolepyruvate oxidoreductase subunit beta [Syntrophomonadaceae bacterium]|jgi:indolepyruvate ferredoxin oxidoreductase beta subunit
MDRLPKDPLNIIICGVGGQGNILASELLASALVEKGYQVTVGETYGASQRGGSVMSHVRVSNKVLYGPLIPYNEADIIVGFEPVEVLRIARQYGNKNTKIIFDPRPNYPLGVLIGEDTYPEIEAIINELNYLCGEVKIIEATAAAQECGNPQAANILLMGSLTAVPEIPLSDEDYTEILKQRFKDKVLEVNCRVFEIGYNLMGENL